VTISLDEALEGASRTAGELFETVVADHRGRGDALTPGTSP
jgi:hypothetical protein